MAFPNREGILLETRRMNHITMRKSCIFRRYRNDHTDGNDFT